MDDKSFKVLKYGEDILKLKADKITNLDEKIIKLITKMRQTMYDYRGIGLAAPQIGQTKQLAIIDLSILRVSIGKSIK